MFCIEYWGMPLWLCTLYIQESVGEEWLSKYFTKRSLCSHVTNIDHVTFPDHTLSCCVTSWPWRLLLGDLYPCYQGYNTDTFRRKSCCYLMERETTCYNLCQTCPVCPHSVAMVMGLTCYYKVTVDVITWSSMTTSWHNTLSSL